MYKWSNKSNWWNRTHYPKAPKEWSKTSEGKKKYLLQNGNTVTADNDFVYECNMKNI